MSLHRNVLIETVGLRVEDLVCDAGPHDAPFEEQHAEACVAILDSGAFRYRSGAGAALLVPGSCLLGNAGACFECSHEHHRGDRCLSFHFRADCLEDAAASVSGLRRATFGSAHLPARAANLPLLSRALVARDREDGELLEECAFELLVHALGGGEPNAGAARVSRRDGERIAEAVRIIDRTPDTAPGIETLAAAVHTSPFHFLRTFKQVVGMPPRQYVLYARLTRAARRIATTMDAIGGIALDCGFGDLSTFARQFRRAFGCRPQEYRARMRRSAH
ncbi:MAG: helix-turn-helix transcriptional regulator [Gammaproteobacteria bacterium]|nr:helix-turn-helix transcriptional regulator [Gammaproteobacteria bacterium]